MFRASRHFARRYRHLSSASRHSTIEIRPGFPEGGVLVVGASATGVQLADENPPIRAAGDALGRRARPSAEDLSRPRRALVDGRFGRVEQRYDEIDDLTRARRLPSPQLVGTPERATLDLNVLSGIGVELVGRLSAVRDGRAFVLGKGCVNHFALADLKMERLLDTFDEWARINGHDADVGPPERFETTRAPTSSRLDLDLRNGQIRSVVWATGFRPEYGWLDVPVIDHKGFLRHEGGVVDAPGMYALGLPVLRRRKSSFIHGAEDDARDVVDHLAGYLASGHQ